jgi:hypothetical protein
MLNENEPPVDEFVESREIWDLMPFQISEMFNFKLLW